MSAQGSPLPDCRASFGVLLPHFGQHTNPVRAVASGRHIEDLGFDAAWARDHLLWKPHGIEGDDRTFIEPLALLNTVGALTSRIALGTAVLIPLRWPLKLAQDLAALSYLHGARVIAGLGTGSNHAELAAAGFDARRRRKIVDETVSILRLAWSSEEIGFAGEIFTFDSVTLAPRPQRPIPLWYGGTTESAVRFAASKFDGWVGGRIPLQKLRRLLEPLDEMEQSIGRHIDRSIIQLVKIDRDRASAWNGVDLNAIAHSVESTEGAGRDGGAEDVHGVVTAGNPDDITTGVIELVEAGIDHVVFDLRLQFDSFESSLELIAEQVMPELRKRFGTAQ